MTAPAQAQLFPGIEIEDSNEAGNQAVPLLEAIARFINTHQCITRTQLLQFEDAINRMEPQMDRAFGRASDRQRVQVNNYRRAFRRDLQDLRQMPICPTPDFWLSVYLVKTMLWLDSKEKSATTGATTNQFSDRKDPLGVGVSVGYNFYPGGNWVISPFVSVDYLNMSVNHTFANGNFLGTTSNFAATFGAKAGPMLANGVWIYGIAGASVLNETLRVNFAPVASSQTTTVPGATVGFGTAFQPGFLQGSGRPVSLFVEYQHTWWQEAHFDTPAASPAFNYNFRREDDTIKFGFMVGLGGGAPAAAPVKPAYPVKAPALK